MGASQVFLSFFFTLLISSSGLASSLPRKVVLKKNSLVLANCEILVSGFRGVLTYAKDSFSKLDQSLVMTVDDKRFPPIYVGTAANLEFEVENKIDGLDRARKFFYRIFKEMPIKSLIPNMAKALERTIGFLQEDDRYAGFIYKLALRPQSEPGQNTPEATFYLFIVHEQQEEERFPYAILFADHRSPGFEFFALPEPLALVELEFVDEPEAIAPDDLLSQRRIDSLIREAMKGASIQTELIISGEADCTFLDRLKSTNPSGVEILDSDNTAGRLFQTFRLKGQASALVQILSDGFGRNEILWAKSQYSSVRVIDDKIWDALMFAEEGQRLTLQVNLKEKLSQSAIASQVQRLLSKVQNAKVLKCFFDTTDQSLHLQGPAKVLAGFVWNGLNEDKFERVILKPELDARFPSTHLDFEKGTEGFLEFPTF